MGRHGIRLVFIPFLLPELYVSHGGEAKGGGAGGAARNASCCCHDSKQRSGGSTWPQFPPADWFVSGVQD